MISSEKLQAIEAAAEAMVNAPELRCQVAMAEIYKRAGLLPQELLIPSGTRSWARAQGRSLIVPWLDASPYFERVEDPQPGDIVAFLVDHTPHHVCILLSGGRFVHVYGFHGVKIAPAMPDAWRDAIAGAWRIK